VISTPAVLVAGTPVDQPSGENIAAAVAAA
jgi:hypothetical protein